MLKVILVAAVSATLCSVAFAGNTPEKAKEKKVCVTPESVLGSRIAPRMVCRTKAEWAAIEASNRRAAAATDETSRDEDISRNFDQQGQGIPRTPMLP